MEQPPAAPSFVGIDVSKDRLDVHVLPSRQAFAIARNGEGLERLAAELGADVNLIDFDRLRLHQPEVVHDLPAGGRRLVQRADGYRATLVAGTPVFENGEETGARPGRLVRAGR